MPWHATPTFASNFSTPAAAWHGGGAWRNLDEPSREAVVAALAEAGGVVSRAALALGLSRQALYRRIERYGLGEA